MNQAYIKGIVEQRVKEVGFMPTYSDCSCRKVYKRDTARGIYMLKVWNSGSRWELWLNKSMQERGTALATLKVWLDTKAEELFSTTKN